MTLGFDRHRLAEIDAQREGRPYGTDDPVWAVTTAFGRAAYRDHDVMSWYGQVSGLLATPDELLSVPGRVERIMQLGGNGDEPVLPGPTRAELVAVVGR